MNLPCQVEVLNRDLCSLNMKSNSRFLKSIVAIRKEPKVSKEYFLFHVSSTNKTGTKYNLKFVTKVFTKCIHEGKTTIRFSEPPHDLFIKCEVLQLKGFLKLLNSCLIGEDVLLPKAASVKIVNDIKTKLVINDRSQLPSNGYPRTLEALQMSGLQLCNFRREILSLKKLVKLDLSDNTIEKLPKEFGRMPNLHELILCNNQLGSKGEIDWAWLEGTQLTGVLKLLDLSGNSLQYLPKSIWKCQKLVTLKIDQNKLENLPSTLGRINTLRYLTISRNSLSWLPCGLMQCKLEHIDLSENKFHIKDEEQKFEIHTHWDYYVGSLLHIASKKVLQCKQFYAPNLIPKTLCEFLDNANMCVCGAPVVNDYYCVTKPYSLKEYFRTVVFDDSTNSTVNVQCFFCSPRCLADVRATTR